MQDARPLDPLAYSTLRVETPENVAIEFPLAGLGSRFAALLVDGTCITAALLAVWLVTGGQGAALLVASVALTWGWFALFEAFADGQTPGKRLLSVRAVMDGGYPLTLRAAAVRNLLRIVDLQPGVSCLLGGFSMLLSRQGKRLGDHAAGTVVVRELPIRFPEVARHAESLAPPRLSDEAFGALERFGERSAQLSVAARERVAGELLRRLPQDLRGDGEGGTRSGVLRRLLEEESARRHAARRSLATGSAAATRLLGRKREAWLAFRASVRAVRARGLRRLDGDGVADFAARYRELAADLARARTYGASPGTLFALERLAGAAHNLFYRPATASVLGVGRFLAAGFPRLVRRLWRPIAVSTLLLYGPALVGYAALVLAPQHERAVGGLEMVARAEDVRATGGDYSDAIGLWMGSDVLASALIANNVQVAFLAFAAGALAGLGTVVILVTNGLHLGSALAVFANRGVLSSIGAFIAPHGFVELSAICIAGGAGLWMGSGLLLPGRLPRPAAFAQRARDAVALVGGVAAMLVVAGVIEGAVSPARIPPGAKHAVGALMAALTVLYFARAGRAGSAPVHP